MIDIDSAGEEGREAIFLSLVAALLGLSSSLGVVSESVSNSIAVIFGSPLAEKKLEVMREVSLAPSNSKPRPLNEYTAGEPRGGTDSRLKGRCKGDRWKYKHETQKKVKSASWKCCLERLCERSRFLRRFVRDLKIER